MDNEQIIFNFLRCQDILLHLWKSGMNRPFNGVEAYGEGLVRKFYLASLNLRQSIGQDTYVSTLDNQSLNYVIDPVTAASTSRTMYESMLAFFHIYVDAPNDEERVLRFFLWQLSSINYHLRTEPTGSAEDAALRVQKEADRVELIGMIKALPIVAALDAVSIAEIDSLGDVKHKTTWEYYIDGVRLRKVYGMTGIQKRLKAKPQTFSNFYALFSNDAHASFSSVDKVLRMFEVPGEGAPDNFNLFDGIVVFATSMSILLIHDYCTFFPEIRGYFDALDPVHKDFINALIEDIKGAEYRL